MMEANPEVRWRTHLPAAAATAAAKLLCPCCILRAAGPLVAALVPRLPPLAHACLPQVARMLNDPDTLRQMAQVMSNPVSAPRDRPWSLR